MTIESEGREEDPKDPRLLSRRGLFYGAAAGSLLVGAAAGFGGGFAARSAAEPVDVVDLDTSYPFYGTGEQAGIRTPQQRYSVYMTFDIAAGAGATDLQVLFARWSGAIAQMMAGKPIGAVQPDGEYAVANDTGEAYELGPAGLTVTLGLGPDVFGRRFGLAPQKPVHLAPLPALPSDNLDPALTGGDLSLQACAEDPQVAYHAIHDLARMAKGTAAVRWTVLGFGRASAGKGQSTPRNLQGFKDGTRNLKEDADYEQFVRVTDDAAWTRGGAYQVVRKIQMRIENWDADRVSDQQHVIGRTKQAGAPLTGVAEFDAPDFAAQDASGNPVIDPTAHIALAAHENNGGLKILRRGYNYTDGLNHYGQLDAGLLFLSYQNDPAAFVALQTKLGSSDLLNEYISHIGSALFFVPPAPPPGRYLAYQLFE
ncbi:iron uptake transporter deferrochelatase/peroxidase subunit [Gryllotalpicola sp.]|uniref:iron uptake transporter deferrochelatase/peroxidase subunit n=1 Tax=Gryllotalpicola sp. TaxID=1932787 RepID=UPI00261938FD|nr:iron uptake transporter deferrochelatase/peroxidase subunit [Gryllotalpicola sp.]